MNTSHIGSNENVKNALNKKKNKNHKTNQKTNEKRGIYETIFSNVVCVSVIG